MTTDRVDRETSPLVRTEALTRIYRVGAQEVRALQGINLEIEQSRGQARWQRRV